MGFNDSIQLKSSNKNLLIFFQVDNVLDRFSVNPPNCEVIPHEMDSEDLVVNKDSASLVSSPPPIQIPVPELPPKNTSKHWVRKSY